MAELKPIEALQKYWGYEHFRPLQEDIINAVLNGTDSLALLPTGGGKSLCFQIPALCQPGLAIVVSPLIALMDDQVQNLKKHDIPALALHSALSFREIDRALDNAANGHYKFLYVSPERLQNELFLERVKRMNVNLLAVDEAHCISQWGYDFRPPYLQIAKFRQLLPQVPVLALTATATPKVVDDIQEKLEFGKKQVFQKSFKRDNLFYNVLHAENPWQRALNALQKIKGTAIIYTRNRKGTVEIARWLAAAGLSADFYHAGLSAEKRQLKQKAWLKGECRIMVCTNAFGMGIDKPDVRLVMHMDLPDSLEAYFQEAGRAGRDGKKAYSLVLVSPNDTRRLEKRHLDSFPDLEYLKRVYQALANFFQLAKGGGEMQTFNFPVNEFLKQYKLPAFKTYQALKIMSKEGLLEMSEGYYQPSRLRITTDRTTLYDFQLRHPKMDLLVKTLVRSYGGLNVEYSRIDEGLLASRLKTSPQTVMEGLKVLHQKKLADYIPSNAENTITFLKDRLETSHLRISKANLEDRYRDLKERIQSVIKFVEQDYQCRSVHLLEYFGESGSEECGGCDVCRRQKKLNLDHKRFNELKLIILEELSEGGKTFTEMNQALSSLDHSEKVLRHLLEEGLIKVSEGRLHREEKNL